MSESCTTCLTPGPVLMPLRYAVVPDSVLQTLPTWAEPQTPFPALKGYHYALRVVRQGFIYVFYDTGVQPENASADWESWSVAENGDLYYQGTTGLGAQLVFNPLPCGRPQHAATNLEHMALNAKALKFETWVAFSHAPWTEETLTLYTTDATARKARMQNIMPAEWTSHVTPQEHGLTNVSKDILNTVMDYQVGGSAGNPFRLLLDEERPTYRVSYIDNGQYGFYAESIKPHTTFHPWCPSRRGQAARSMKAMDSRSMTPQGKPVLPLTMALQDPVGIAHELAHWGDMLAQAHQSYLDELNIEFATWRNINGVKSQVEQMTTAQQAKYTKAHGGQDLQTLYQTMSNVYSREQIKQFYDEGTVWANQQGIAYDWGKYAHKLNTAKLSQFTTVYDQFCRVINGYMTPLIGLRLQWLQDPRFIQCLGDHNTSKTDDYLNYREIVGYAVASINIIPAGRKLIQRWINEYSTSSKANLFWRSQFFNDPALMQEMTPVLTEMKQQAAKKDEPIKESDKTAMLTAFNSFMGVLGKHGESCDRALEALEKDSKSANVSLTRKMLAWGDSRLTTLTSEVFNKTVMGANLDSANELFYKWLFARDAGVEESAIKALINSQMDTGSQGATAFRNKMALMLKENPNISLSQEISNKYSNDFQKMISSSEGKRHIDVSRIKLLGVFLNMWEFSNQIDEAMKGGGSASGVMSSALFTASAGIQVTLPAFEIMAKVTENNLPTFMGNFPSQGAKLSQWRLRANACGSLAAALAVINDLGELAESFDKDGAKRWQAAGLASAKVFSDGAFAIQSSEDLLKLLGQRTLQTIITDAVGDIVANNVLRVIGYMASWQVMVLVAIAPVIIAIFSDDDLQDWCEQCAFGSNSDVKNTGNMPLEKQASISQEQEDKLVKALHETLGLPLSEKLQKEEDAENLRQLKAEAQAWQHVHN